MRLHTIAASVTLLCACATTTRGPDGGEGGNGAVDTTRFPSRDALARLAAADLPFVKADVHADVASWTLTGPLPDRIGDAPMAAGGIRDVVLAAVPASETSENLACAARELAIFLSANGGKPPEQRLKSWMLLRCGLTSGDVAMHPMTWSKVPADIADADVWKDARPQLTEMVTAMKKGVALVAIELVRDVKAGTAMALVVGANHEARIDAAPQLVPAAATSVVVSGALPNDVEVIYAYAGKGLLDAAECELDLSVVLPKFRFTCAVDAADATTRIDIVKRSKGRVLGDGAGELLVVRDGAASNTYREAIYGEPTADLLGAINRVRATAGRRPLSRTAAQSDVVQKVAPHYFANLFAESPDPGANDDIALGLMAGWDVSELTIHDAGFCTLLDASGGGDDLLGSALDHPSARAVLLNAKASAAAIAPTTLEGGVMGALVVTYEALEAPDHATGAKAVFEKLRAIRKERGLGQTGAIPTEAIMLEAAQRLQAGEEIDSTVRKALDASAKVMQRPFTIWSFEVHDVDHMAFPDELLTAKTTYVAVAVATRKRAKSAWGSTIVLVLGFVEDVQVAMTSEERTR